MDIMDILELTITSCIHLIRTNLDDTLPEAKSFASGVIVKYRERYFLCTVAHFANHHGQNVCIVTGRKREEDNYTEMYPLGSLSYIEEFKFEPDFGVEDIEFALENPDRCGVPFDMAFTEIPLLDNIIQDEKIFHLKDGRTLHIKRGGKAILIVDKDYEIDQTQLCSFFGRIRPNPEDNIYNFQEMLYYGLPITNINEYRIEMELGNPIKDTKRFTGCSGAPVIDTRGKLIGLITHSLFDTNKSVIYAFRFDKIKMWIDRMYFQLENI